MTTATQVTTTAYEKYKDDVEFERVNDPREIKALDYLKAYDPKTGLLVQGKVTMNPDIGIRDVCVSLESPYVSSNVFYLSTDTEFWVIRPDREPVRPGERIMSKEELSAGDVLDLWWSHHDEPSAIGYVVREEDLGHGFCAGSYYWGIDTYGPSGDAVYQIAMRTKKAPEKPKLGPDLPQILITEFEPRILTRNESMKHPIQARWDEADGNYETAWPLPDGSRWAAVREILGYEVIGETS